MLKLTQKLAFAAAMIWTATLPGLINAQTPTWSCSSSPCWTNDTVGIGTTSPAGPLQIHAGTNENLLIEGPINLPGAVSLSSANDAITANTPMEIRGNPVPFLIGNVGIGTTNPQHLLHVAGTIGAEEVNVSSTGADYVFGPDYRLPSLTEVAAYIADHHHLPDLPSASEVQAKGVSLGEMQSKLLAKIEELTLHMIQADERSNRLEQENADLRAELRQIQERIGQ
ncbi:MAG TPA: cell division protein ZapB [Bryobacteraceae bacterium]|jgi:hypothetical protein